MAHKTLTPRVAVIGTGVSGLSAAWHVNQFCSVTVYEAEESIGGHVKTELVPLPNGSARVDMGFIVYNVEAYPNLTALFKHLGIATQETDMSLAISMDNGKIEYAGGYLSQLVAQKRNLLRPRFWSMLSDLVRFYRTAPNDLNELEDSGEALGEYLRRKRYGAAFRDDHLLPMAAAIWSTGAGSMLEFPAAAFIRFYDNHGLLKLVNRPVWRTVSGGSQTYVQKIVGSLARDVRTLCPVKSVSRQEDGVLIVAEDGSSERYDHAIIATHADQALALLAQPTPEERHLLGAFRYTQNPTYLHGDISFMPRRRRAWASWNYVGRGEAKGAGEQGPPVTYWMNQLQSLNAQTPILVTLNPTRPPESVYASHTFEHPVLDRAAINAQKQLWSLQGKGGVWYCGAYFGSGFHEDGLQAGLAVGEAITGKRRPWSVANESSRIHLRSQMTSQLEAVA